MSQQFLNEEQRKALRVYQEYEKLWSIIERTQPLEDDSVLPKDLQDIDQEYGYGSKQKNRRSKNRFSNR